ncbi:hypothetical protein [Brevibacillus choshinensis]|uniref:hypothetical protein n=1 Tax=Brevibacillus choshinensis TaxID=54911 RepID=UPI002E1CD1D6|nr:hypothetical protein [Brevibacillus choshinensis]
MKIQFDFGVTQLDKAKQIKVITLEDDEMPIELKQMYDFIEMFDKSDLPYEEVRKKFERKLIIDEAKLKEHLADRSKDTGKKYAPYLHSSSVRKQPDAQNFNKYGKLDV